jgi:CheY-like chemotaxis protein
MIQSATPSLLADLLADGQADPDTTARRAVPNVVVVDPRFDSYPMLAASAHRGRIGLHFRTSGTDALRLARRLPVNAWLIAAELDDMSGHDLVRLLDPGHQNGPATAAAIAIVESSEPGGRRWLLAESEAHAVGADALMSHPISLRDLEALLELTLEERSAALGSPPSGSFIRMPVGIGAAVVAMAVLFLG